MLLTVNIREINIQAFLVDGKNDFESSKQKCMPILCLMKILLY